MTVNDLSDGQTVRYRVGRYAHGMSHPKWEPWTTGPLYIQRDDKGRVCVLAIRDRLDWAEYDPRRDEPDQGTFVTEGYYLEIAELSGNKAFLNRWAIRSDAHEWAAERLNRQEDRVYYLTKVIENWGVVAWRPTLLEATRAIQMVVDATDHPGFFRVRNTVTGYTVVIGQVSAKNA